MALEKRTFLGGMSKDKDTRLIENGSYEDALNIRVASSSDGTIGSVENVEGNQEVNMNFFSPSSDALFEINGGVYEEVNPTSVFYRQVIEISGTEINGQTYNFSLYSKHLGSLVGLGGYSWVGIAQRRATASELHPKFTPKGSNSFQDIAVYDNNTGNQYSARVVDLSFNNNSQLGGGVFAITIECTTPGIPFTLDASSSIDPLEYVNSSVLTDIPISSDSSLSIDISSSFETGGDINTDTSEFGANVGAFLPEVGENQTAYKLSVSGIEPTSPVSSSAVTLFSYCPNLIDGAYEITEVLTFNPSEFDTGGGFELSSSQTSLSNYITTQLSTSLVLTSDDVVPFAFSLAPSNIYYNFTEATILNDNDLEVSFIGPSGISFSLALSPSEGDLLSSLTSGEDLIDNISLFNGVNVSISNIESLSNGSTLPLLANITELISKLEELELSLSDSETLLEEAGQALINKQEELQTTLDTLGSTEEDLEVALEAVELANAAKVEAEDALIVIQSEIVAIIPEDGITQLDVDAVQTQLDAVGSAVVDLEAQLATAMENQEDGITQADVNAVQALLDAVVPEDGITQADVDAAYADGAASVTADDGSTPFNQADVDAAYADGATALMQSYVDNINQLSAANFITENALTAENTTLTENLAIANASNASIQALIDDLNTSISNATSLSGLITTLGEIEGLIEEVSALWALIDVINTNTALILTQGLSTINANKGNVDSTYNSLIGLSDGIPLPGFNIYSSTFDVPESPISNLSFTLLNGVIPGESEVASFYDSEEGAYKITGPFANEDLDAAPKLVVNNSALDLSSLHDGDELSFSVSFKLVPKIEGDDIPDGTYQIYSIFNGEPKVVMLNTNNNFALTVTEPLLYNENVYSELVIYLYNAVNATNLNVDVLVQDISITANKSSVEINSDNCLTAQTALNNSITSLESEISSEGEPDISILFPEDDTTPTAFTKLNDYALAVSLLAEAVNSGVSSVYSSMQLALSTSIEDFDTLQSTSNAYIAELEAQIAAVNSDIADLQVSINSGVGLLSEDSSYLKSVVSFWGPGPTINSLPPNQGGGLIYFYEEEGAYITPEYFESFMVAESGSELRLLTHEQVNNFMTSSTASVYTLAEAIIDNLSSLATSDEGWYIWEWEYINVNTGGGYNTQRALVKLLNFDSTTGLTEDSPTYQYSNLFINSELVTDYSITNEFTEVLSLGGLHILIQFDENDGSNLDYNGAGYNRFTGFQLNNNGVIATHTSGNYTLKNYLTTIQTP